MDVTWRNHPKWGYWQRKVIEKSNFEYIHFKFAHFVTECQPNKNILLETFRNFYWRPVRKEIGFNLKTKVAPYNLALPIMMQKYLYLEKYRTDFAANRREAL